MLWDNAPSTHRLMAVENMNSAKPVVKVGVTPTLAGCTVGAKAPKNKKTVKGGIASV